MMALRLRDIARELDVSTITVSKAIRGAKDISEKTRQRILKRIKELDNQPNMAARSAGKIERAAASHKNPESAEKRLNDHTIVYQP